MEQWDLYDLDRQKIGEIEQGQPLSPEDCRLVVHVCIFNKKGEMLIQQRQSFKEGWPNLWDLTAGGSALLGENSRQAAARELREELGLHVDFEKRRPHLTVHFDQGFDDIYLVEAAPKLGDLTLQYTEVRGVMWASEKQILEMIQAGTFLPYRTPFLSLLFSLHGQRGCLEEEK